VFIVTLAVGTLVVAAITLSPLYARRLEPMGSTRLGLQLVGLAIGLAVFDAAARGRAPLPWSELFVFAFCLLLLGALLIVGDGDDPDDDDADDDGDDPWWWPEFEAGFRSYARRRRPLVPTR
jgi:hypothetical protein